jgi:hypothetical protein
MCAPAARWDSAAMNSMATRTTTASHQFAYPVVRPVPRPPVAVLGSSDTW